MNKDVIYIDVEDDITAIISKVKASKEKIVALVPPKRTGVLQSAVNLRLLARTAEQHSKRLVLITGNHALMSLAAAASLPVAKNLQSKPELPEITALEVGSDDDIIDGNDLPVGEHAKQMGDDAVDAIAAPVVNSASLKPGSAANQPKGKSGVKVPNFNTFRKKMMLGVGLGVAFIVFLVWAIFFAPHATITVAAKTNDSSVNTDVKASDTLKTDSEKNTIKAVVAKKTDEKSVDFTATGTKNVGEKATSSVEFSQQSQSATTVPAGTRLTTSGGLVFVTDSAVTVPASTIGGSCFPTACPGTASVGVTAREAGAKYNGATGSMSGAPSGVSAQLESATSGGTDKIAKVVTAGDIQKAKEDLVKDESDTAESDLKKSFKGEVKVIDGSFGVDYSNVKSTPALGTEAEGGNATLSATVTYRVSAIEKTELDSFLNAYMKKVLEGSDNQRVYDNGADKAKFQDVETKKTESSFTLIATAKIGPKLDVNEIKNQAKGKKGGEIQEALQNIQGVEDVDVSYFPFWVGSVPGDTKKISVQFKVDE